MVYHSTKFIILSFLSYQSRLNSLSRDSMDTQLYAILKQYVLSITVCKYNTINTIVLSCSVVCIVNVCSKCNNAKSNKS